MRRFVSSAAFVCAAFAGSALAAPAQSAPVTLALLYGAAPDALVLVVDPTRPTIGNYSTPTLGYQDLIAAYEGICAMVKPAKVVGIALNTRQLTDAAAREKIERAREQTKLPVDDVVRNGPHALYDAIAPQLIKRQHLTAEFLA